MTEGRSFIIPEDPTPYQLRKLLAICSNSIATLAEQVAGARKVQAERMTEYKQETAKARLINQNKGSVKVVDALVEIDDDVIQAQRKLQDAVAYAELLSARAAGYDAHFKALRKIAEIKKVEMSNLG